MNEDNKEELQDDEINDIRLENELKRIKLSLEHGTDFSLPPEANLPPEVESKWLDYMQQFEDAYSQHKNISVFEFVGKPDFKPESLISDEDIEEELENVMTLLRKYEVLISTICEVEDRVLYKFITEELFNETTDDIRIPGMMHCFIYEEFHPNHEYDIKNVCTHFINSVLDKEKECDPEDLNLTDDFFLVKKSYSSIMAMQKISDFRDAFSLFTITELITGNVTIDDNKSELRYNISYTGTMEGSSETIDFEGSGFFKLSKDDGYWKIYDLEIVGITL